MPTVHLWIEADGPRPRFAAQQLLGALLGWEVRFAASADELRTADGPRLAYARLPVPGAFHLLPHGWLGASGAQRMEPEVLRRDGLALLFPVAGGGLPFDPLAAAFFCLSRCEEYGDALPRDPHGRPATAALHAARHGYLERPVVDEWALLLARAWAAADPRVPPPVRAYRQVATIDLDNGLKYLGRPLWRSAGAWARDALRGEWRDAAERLRVLLGRQPDPYLLDEAVLEALRASAGRVAAFVLAAPRGAWDHAVPVAHPRYQRALRGLAERIEVGLHPSYRTSEAPGMAQREREALERSVGRAVRISRQHFLRFRLPGTFRERIAMGLREEHSMGLHDRIGFRAGTCTPFAWYDLERDTATGLIIHPFAVMDSALDRKMGVAPAEAPARVRPVIDAVRRVEGAFTGLWHESYLARTGAKRAWRAAILAIAEAAKP